MIDVEEERSVKRARNQIIHDNGSNPFIQGPIIATHGGVMGDTTMNSNAEIMDGVETGENDKQCVKAGKNHIHNQGNHATESITAEDNVELMRIPDDAKIFKALKGMKSWKTPRPDGFPPGFFKTHWSIVGKDVVDMVQQFFRTGYLLKSLNSTNVSLIPKTKNKQFPSDLRPIALCNTSYKIISKIMSSRMKKLMCKIISPLQAAYVPGRQISENIQLAQEIIHTMKNKKQDTKYLALKLDMFKAFDRLEWSFIKDVMIQMGFSHEWCNLIMQCITTTKISILLNGAPCAAYNQHEAFDKADLHNVNNLMKVIEDFSNASGPIVNFTKSGVNYSAQVPQRVKHRFSSWDGKTMSQCGKSLMVKTVTNTIPTYSMRCFQIPADIINKIEAAQRDFWWGFEDKRGTYVTSWKSLGFHKDCGGQGFRDLKILNQALLVREAWRICTNTDAHWGKAIQAKYFSCTSLLHATVKTNCSRA
ncbi:uncharacterized protein LOC113360589 [Papaver somniferum]|uniref:uncharacterized protein LOC113360589 n=1 Tax=Papaver somniferum TaxID=3469 RepID=UPI000E704568|nr:uncharacterized protein LOC113360589 [Papaver somniferum]